MMVTIVLTISLVVETGLSNKVSINGGVTGISLDPAGLPLAYHHWGSCMCAR